MFSSYVIIEYIIVLVLMLYFNIYEACIGVLGIQDICHFTSRDIGYFPFYFQDTLYGIWDTVFNFKDTNNFPLKYTNTE